jgi:hypothetical protein
MYICPIVIILRVTRFKKFINKRSYENVLKYEEIAKIITLRILIKWRSIIQKRE